jgi:uncharacterized protein (DUF1800 family)
MKTIKIAFLAAIFLSCLLINSRADEIPSDLKVYHVLNRLGFGPAPGDIQRVRAMGVEAYIQQQLSPDTIALPDGLAQKLDSLATLHMTPLDLLQEYWPMHPGQKLSAEERKERRQKSQIIMIEARQARLMRAIESPRQLQEVMTDFWFNHFNIYAEKELDRLWTGAFEEETIRPNALGRFRDLLEATARHPAMLFYLDNWKNVAPGTGRGKNANQGINENYARELMELHTLGVNGGYTQDDVVALARILTGWGFGRDPERTDRYGFLFNRRRHDFSDKTFLGHAVQGTGEDEVEEVLDILARHPSTARHICYQLAEYFVSDDPDEDLVNSLAQKFLSSGGDIREVLNTLFHSPQFWDRKNYGHKFKTPYQYVISSIRATGQKVDNFQPLLGALMQQGMPLYGCLTPDGYKHTQDAWLNPDSMLRRLSFATALSNGNVKINDNPLRVDPLALSESMGNHFSSQTDGAVKKAPERLKAAMLLGSPESMRY